MQENDYLCEMKYKLLIVAAVAALMAVSCATPKEILYFQDIDNVSLNKLTTEYEAVIKKDDRLSILVSGPDKTVTAPYNLTLGEMGINGASLSSRPEETTLTYLVDADGNIDFPILGLIHVEGMTRRGLVNYLTEAISKDVHDPIVYVSIKNYKITILGEVRNPGMYTIDSEKISLLQALGMAGDLTLTAQRDGIILIREVDGVNTHTMIDLKNSDILQSPYYFLQQNDILYIPPSATRVASATMATGIWSIILSSVTTLIAVIGVIF